MLGRFSIINELIHVHLLFMISSIMANDYAPWAYVALHDYFKFSRLDFSLKLYDKYKKMITSSS